MITLKKFNKFVVLPILICTIYWGYLILTTKMEIKFDAGDYESLGALIYHKGWIGYFQTGPNREPLYPFLISISMLVADVFQVSYQRIQVIFQLLILLITQILSYTILKKLRINQFVISFTILYIGFSPALVNSALSLFSEIISCPLVLLLVLLGTTSFKTLQTKSWDKAIILGILTGIIFVLAASAKGAFAYLFYIFLLPYLALASWALTKKYYKIIVNSVLYLCFLSISFVFLLNLYQSLNFKYNGQFVLTNRGNWMLYGCTAKRTDPLIKKKILPGIASVAGDNICSQFFSEEDCSLWAFRKSDHWGFIRNDQLFSMGLSAKEVNSRLITEAKNLAGQHPFQYGLMSLIDTMKIFFWESTKIGFVEYPSGLTKVFNFTPFKNGLRAGISLLTVLSFVFLYSQLWIKRKFLLNVDSGDERTALLLVMGTIMISFIGVYSFFSILTRYAFPIVPLYLISIAYFLDKTFKPRA